MRFYKTRGFTLVELLVSIGVIGILAILVVPRFNDTQWNDELRSASRKLAGTLRNAQSRALSGELLRVCALEEDGEFSVCELSDVGCWGSCEDQPVVGYGLHLLSATTSYSLFADVWTPRDYRQTSALEVIQSFSVLALAGDRVLIDRVIVYLGEDASIVEGVDVSFTRQSGELFILDPALVEQDRVDLILRHVKTDRESTVRIDRTTGRIFVL